MKKILAALAFALVATQANALIANGSHDLSDANVNLRTEYDLGANINLSSCQFCHAPHNVNTTITGLPLWNRTAPATTYDAGEVYASNTLKFTQTAGNVVTLGANSLTCLSCHDGATDMGATYTGSKGYSPAGTTVLMQQNFGLGAPNRDVAVGSSSSAWLTDDHPVGIPMIDGTDGFRTVAYAEGLGFTFYAGNVECGSCHDPHGDSDGASGGPSFLRVSATGLCAGCHNK